MSQEFMHDFSYDSMSLWALGWSAPARKAVEWKDVSHQGTSKVYITAFGIQGHCIGLDGQCTTALRGRGH